MDKNNKDNNKYKKRVGLDNNNSYDNNLLKKKDIKKENFNQNSNKKQINNENIKKTNKNNNNIKYGNFLINDKSKKELSKKDLSKESKKDISKELSKKEEEYIFDGFRKIRIYPCKHCGRKFIEKSLKIHSKICPTVFGKKKQKLLFFLEKKEINNMVIFYKKNRLLEEKKKQLKKGKGKNVIPKWKKQSLGLKKYIQIKRSQLSHYSNK